MKKKKPPIALMSVLVLAVLGLVTAGGAFKFYNMSPEDQQKQLQADEQARQRAAQAQQAATPVASQTKDKASTKEVDAMRKRVEDAAKAGAPPTTSRAAKGVTATMPTVVMPDQAITKPVENKASPSSQWYKK